MHAIDQAKIWIADLTAKYDENSEVSFYDYLRDRISTSLIIFEGALSLGLSMDSQRNS